MKLSALISLLALLFFVACSGSEPEKVKPANETVLENQIKAIEKARQVEQILNEEALKRQQELDKYR